MVITLSSLNDAYASKKFDLKVKKTKIRGTYTRADPSWLIADLSWIALSIIAAFVVAGAILEERRSEFMITITGGPGQTDFSDIKPEALIQFLASKPDQVQKSLDYGNKRLHYLAFFVDHLPSFISKPNRVTTLLAYICTLCCIWRFWLLHRKWRFNNVFVFGTYGLWIILSWTTQLDDALVTWTAIYLVLPLLSLCSVILHRMLGSNAWKPPTFSIEEANERHELRPMARNEDTEALLNSDEMNKK